MAVSDSNRRAHNFKDLTGQPFGRLSVLSLDRIEKRPFPSGTKSVPFWHCQCECGNTTSVMAGNLRNGNTRSCGCLERDVNQSRLKTHGMTGSPEYRSWCHIIGRCYNETDMGYPSYGGRGITVCERWRTSFANFFADMGPKPDGCRISIERRENDGHYEPGNCYWATPKQQNRNRRNTRLLTFDGRTQCIAAWAEEIGMTWDTLRARLALGWSAERALTEPVGHFRASASSATPSL
jgi:hypothetical protein